MASSSANLPSPQLKSLDKLFDCPVCIEKFVDPHILLCGHHFCRRCLEGIASPSGHEQMGITCPTCRQTTNFSTGTNVCNLPRPVLLNELQQKIIEINCGSAKGDMKIFCDCCAGGKASATGHCYQCNKNLCESCESRHKKMDLFAKHKIAPITTALFCRSHVKELVTAFCTECEQGVCLLCAMGDHGEHVLKDIEDSANHSRANLQQYIESQEMKDLDCNVLVDITSKKNELREAHQVIKTSTNALRSCAGQFVNRLDAVDRDVDESLAAELKGLELREFDISYSYASQKSLVRYAKQLLEFNSDPEVVMREKEFQRLPVASPKISFKHTMKVPVVEKFNDLLHYTFKLIADTKAEYQDVTFEVETSLEENKEGSVSSVEYSSNEMASSTETCDSPVVSFGCDVPNPYPPINAPACIEASRPTTGSNTAGTPVSTQDMQLGSEHCLPREATSQNVTADGLQKGHTEVPPDIPGSHSLTHVAEEPPKTYVNEEVPQASNGLPHQVVNGNPQESKLEGDKSVEADPPVRNISKQTKSSEPRVKAPPTAKNRKYVEISIGCDVRGLCFDSEQRTLVARTADVAAPLKVFNYDGTGVCQMGKGIKGLTQVKRIAIDTSRNLYITPVDDCLVTMDKSNGKVVNRISVSRYLCGVSYCAEKDVYVVSSAPTGRHDGRIYVVDPSTSKVVSSFSSRGAAPYNVHSGFLAGIADPGILVSNRDNGCLKVFDLQGQWLTTYERNFEGEKILGHPQDVCTDPKGRIIVCDTASNKVVKLWTEDNQTFTQQRDVGFNPWAVAVDPVEKLMAVTVEYSLIRMFAEQSKTD